MRQQISMDTPHGRLLLQWPAGQLIYDGLEAVAEEPPQHPGPYATLDGAEISVERAREIIAEMQQATSGAQALHLEGIERMYADDLFDAVERAQHGQDTTVMSGGKPVARITGVT